MSIFDEVYKAIGKEVTGHIYHPEIVSSNIIDAWYDKLEGCAYVLMQGKPEPYEYPDISLDEFENFVNSGSPGGYINAKRSRSSFQKSR